MPQDDPDRQVNLDEWEKLTFEKYGVPENLRQSIVGQESGGDVNAKSPTGVSGRYQVTKATASQYGYDRDDQWQQPVAAAKHLRTLYDGVKQRHPDFDDKTAWLGASAEYYYGGNAFDKDGNLSDRSRDGYSTPAKYAQGIAEKWSAFDKGQSPKSTARRIGIKSAEGMNFDLNNPQEATRPKQASYWDASAEDARRGLQERHDAGMAEARARQKEEVAKDVASETPSTRYFEALGRGGLQLSRMARQGLGAGLGLAQGLAASKFTPVDFPGWRQGEEQAMRYAQERQAARPSSFGTDVAEGIIEGAPTAAAAIGGGLLTGGGLPAAMAIGGGMGAAGADWSNPERAAIQTGINAVAPIVGGQVGSKIGGAVSSRLANPTARALAAGGGEITGGAAGNVLGRAADVGVFEGRMLTPGEAAREATIGAALNAPGAYGAARNVPNSYSSGVDPAILSAAASPPTRPDIPIVPRGRTAPLTRPGVETPARPVAPTDPASQIVADYTDAVERIQQAVPAGPEQDAQIAALAAEYRAARRSAMATPAEAAVTPEAQPAQASQLPPGVQVVRIQQGEQAPPRQRGVRQFPIDVELADGSVESVLVIAPNGANESTLRPQIQEALRNPAAQPAMAGTATAQPPSRQPRRQTMFANYGQPQRPTFRRNEAVRVNRGGQQLEGTFQNQTRAGQIQVRLADGRLIYADEAQVSRPQMQAIPDPTEPLPPLSQGGDQGPTAILAGPSSLPSRKLLGPASTQMLPTEGLPPDAPETARLPGMPRTIRAEDEPTAELTGPRGVLQAEQALTERRTAEIPRQPQQDLTNRITTGDGSELPRRVSRPLEGQPVELPRPQPRAPRATPANIDALRSRYADLDRIANDRRGDFTGDLRSEMRELGSVIADFDNQQARGARGNRFSPDAEPSYTRQSPEPPMTQAEKAARRLALQPRPRTSGLLQASTPGRPVTQEMQIPSARDVRRDFNSREDARRGHFDTLTDDELVAEVGRLQDVQSDAIHGKSKLTREQLEANRFDLKIVVEQQKERGAVQKAQGVDEANRIAPRTLGVKKTPRVIQHEQFGEVTEATDQKGVPRGKLRVVGAGGESHEIQNPRTKGNRVAAFVKAQKEQPQTPQPGARGPAVDRPIPMQASGKPSAPRQQAQFEGEAAEYTGKKSSYNRKAVYEIEMTEGAFKGQKRWIQTAPPKVEATPKVAESAPAGNQLVRKMLEIKPSVRTGAPVEIRKLREQFPNLNKESFDAEMLKLAEAGKIGLHRHDYASSLSEADRSALVREKKKTQLSPGEDPYNYFIAATIPEGKGHIMGMGLGSLQGLFKGRKAPSANPTTADIEGASLGKAIGNIFRTGAQGLRTIKTSFDLSAPFGQAAFLTVPHPLKSARSFGQMLRSLKPSQSDAIDAEIAFHPLRKLGEEAGLYLATSAKLKGDVSGGEEAFMVKGLNRVPGIGASERTYRTYLDTLRMSVWEGYVKSLQADGYTWENNPKAYRDAAAGINIASGRGSIKKGGKIEKAMDLGGDILFSPRNFVAKFQRLDPVRYATLAPGARKLVLRDALTTFGVMLGTAALLKARGADISLNPEDDNFMVARLGDTRCDLTVGAKTQVQFLARMAMGAYRKKTGEGNLPYKDPLSVAASFMRNQLAPGPSFAMEAFGGVDAKGEKLADKSPGKIARETIAPMMVDDFYEAYEKEGKAGVAKTLPAIVGARVSNYPDRAKAAFLDAPAELRAEQKQAGMTRALLTPKRGEAGNKADDETPAQFAARKARADEWTTKYGRELVGSEAYKSASKEEKAKALDYLKRTITGQSDEKRPGLYLLNPASILATIRQSEREKRRKAARR